MRQIDLDSGLFRSSATCLQPNDPIVEVTVISLHVVNSLKVPKTGAVPRKHEVDVKLFKVLQGLSPFADVAIAKV